MAMYDVLFVEDDFMTIDAIVNHLEICGLTTTVIDNVGDAVVSLMWDEFRFIFLDVMLGPGDIFTLEETAEGRYTGLKLAELVYTNDKFSKAQSSGIALITNWREEPQVDATAERFGLTIFRKPLTLRKISKFVNL